MLLEVEQLEQSSSKMLARMVRTALSEQEENKYAKWTSVSHLDWVELYKKNRDGSLTLLTRDQYPLQFDDYLPDFSGGDPSYSVSTLPGRRQVGDGAFQDGVRICLGDIWDTKIVTDMDDRFLTGTDSHITDADEKESQIDGWTLLSVEITKEDDREKVAHLHFQQRTGASAPPELIARWGWSKRAPTGL